MLFRRHDVVELYSHNNVLSDFNRIRLHFRAESQYFSLWLTRGKDRISLVRYASLQFRGFRVDGRYIEVSIVWYCLACSKVV